MPIITKDEFKRLSERDALFEECVAALDAILSHPRTSDECLVFMPKEIARARAVLRKVKP